MTLEHELDSTFPSLSDVNLSTQAWEEYNDLSVNHENGNIHDKSNEDLNSKESGVPPALPRTSVVPPPDGGAQAWLQVLGAWILYFNTWGLMNTFGVFQTYYESGQLFNASSSNISWIGAVQSFVVLLVGAFSGPVFDRGYVRHLLVTGGFLVVFGNMMLSLCTEYWQVLLAQSFTIGIGAGMIFVPAVAILPGYFSRRLGTALGIAATGSSIGGIVYPIIFYRLHTQVGFAWATRVIGFVALITMLVPIVVMRQRSRPTKVRALIDKTAFTDIPFMTFVLGSIFGFMGYTIGAFYISFFGQATRITSAELSFYLVPILNAASFFGRTLPNILSDQIGPLNVITPGALIVGVLLFCNIAVDTLAGILITTIFFGFFSGMFIALPTVCFVQLTEDKSVIGTRIGQGFAMAAIGLLVGGPAGGAILQRIPGNLDFTGLWALGGASGAAASLVYLVVRYMRVGFKVVAKA